VAKEEASKKCQECQADISFHLRNCHVCDADIGYPNVRAADSERPELLNRYSESVKLAKIMSLSTQLRDFENSMHGSQAVMIRAVADVIPMLAKNTQLYNTFAHQVSAGIRVAEDNLWDRSREAVESLIHPIYHRDIQYAVLSLDEYGANDPSYGGCHLSFKEITIKKRATVFEENSFEFVKRHQIIAGVVPVPKGYRATWDERHLLAVSKLSSKINKDTTLIDHKNILLSGYGKLAEFIEVHIYGVVHISSFDKLSISKGASSSEIATLSAYCSKISGLKIKFPKD
jgi:hypothetical protein